MCCLAPFISMSPTLIGALRISFCDDFKRPPFFSCAIDVCFAPVHHDEETKAFEIAEEKKSQRSHESWIN